MVSASGPQALADPGRPIPRPFALPWGSGQVVEKVSVLQPYWEPTIQLLRDEDGFQGPCLCYYHGSRFGRGPMALDEEALEGFRRALEDSPPIRGLLRCMLA